MQIDAAEFRRLWESGTPAATIARCFGVTVNAMYRLRKQLGIAARPERIVATDDPTPSQIAERAAAIRERHLAEMRALG